MLAMADFDEAYSGVSTPSPFMKRPAPAGFIASYPPVTPIGQEGPFFVNTYFLQKDRVYEAGGKAVPVRSRGC